MTTAESIIDGCANPLNEHQRQMLKDMSNVYDGNTYTKENKALNDYIETLRDMYPEKFHTKDTLKQRVFFDEPAALSTPHAKFIRARANTPYLDLK